MQTPNTWGSLNLSVDPPAQGSSNLFFQPISDVTGEFGSKRDPRRGDMCSGSPIERLLPRIRASASAVANGMPRSPSMMSHVGLCIHKIRVFGHRLRPEIALPYTTQYGWKRWNAEEKQNSTWKRGKMGRESPRTVHERAKRVRTLRLQLDVEGPISWKVEKPMRHSETIEKGQ